MGRRRPQHFAEKLIAAGLCGECGRRRQGHERYCDYCEAGTAAVEGMESRRRQVHTLTPRVPGDLADRVKAAAHREGLSINQWCLLVFARAVEERNGHE